MQMQGKSAVATPNLSPHRHKRLFIWKINQRSRWHDHCFSPDVRNI